MPKISKLRGKFAFFEMLNFDDKRSKKDINLEILDAVFYGHAT
jgi:hypothetical protein